jgi:type I restriction enzyme S subunit
MNRDLLLTHFNRISDAPDAIPRLRRFILDLAVRGKLVEQDSNEEPASELLERIQAEKARLVKEGRINLERSPTPACPEDLAFELRPKWQAVRISQILVELQTGPFGSSLHQSDYQKGGIPVINPASIKNERLVPIDRMAVGPATLKRLATFKLRAGDIVMARRGEMGRCAVVTKLEEGWLCGTGSLILRLPSCVCARFFVILIGSPFVREYLGGSAVGATMQNLNQSILLNLIVGLPPLAEQHRILTKVDELMLLCDQLEAARTEREARRISLAAASHHHLNNGSSPKTFRRYAKFYLDHLSQLIFQSDQIQPLRQTILNLAVRGQLVPQDPDDEPTSELLKRIQTEVAHSVGAGNTKERKKLRVSASKNAAFKIPRTWLWVTLDQIAVGFRYGTSVKCSYERTGEPVLRIPNIVNGGIKVEDLKFGLLAKREADELRLRFGDILIVRSNGSLDLVGRPALVDANAVGYCYAGYLIRVRISAAHLAARYVLLALNSAHVRDQIEIPIRTTVGLKNVNATELGSLVVPLPPLAEQNRIVAKVDELMTLCDRLEKQLIEADAKSHGLLEATLHQALRDSRGAIDRGFALQA